jgi:hypothetical protein
MCVCVCVWCVCVCLNVCVRVCVRPRSLFVLMVAGGKKKIDSMFQFFRNIWEKKRF